MFIDMSFVHFYCLKVSVISPYSFLSLNVRICAIDKNMRLNPLLAVSFTVKYICCACVTDNTQYKVPDNSWDKACFFLSRRLLTFFKENSESTF